MARGAQNDPNKGLQPGTKFFSPFPFGGMNTQASPIAMADSDFVYVENFLKIGDGNFRTAWDKGAMLYMAPAGRTIVSFYFYTIGPVYYVAVFLSDGSAIQVNVQTTTTTTIGGAGTFYDSANGLLPATTQWGTQYLLISNVNSTDDYWIWDGSILYASGGIAPNGVNILANGSGYITDPTVTVYGGSGSGIVLTPTINAGGVVQLAVTNPGSGYTVGDNPQVAFAGGGSDDSAILEAVIASSGVAAVNVTDGGAGYDSSTTISFSGTGSGASADAVIGYEVASVAVTAPGSGYSTATVQITPAMGDTTGLGATATAKIGKDVATIVLDAGGTGYTTAPTVTITPAVGDTTGSGATATATVTAGVVTALTLTAPGSGYTALPTVSFGGPGTGATAHTTLAATGTIVGLTLTSGGMSYTLAPTVTITGTGTGATATSTLATTGAVIAINMTNTGSGYSTAPTVIISGTGTGASAEAFLNIGGVTSVNVINPGTGFTEAPQITFVGGGGTGASGIVYLEGTSIVGVNVTSTGQNYQKVPTVQILGGSATTDATLVATLQGGGVGSIQVINGGAGYTTSPELLIVPATNDTGTGATATAVFAPTGIGGVIVSSAGSGYTSAPAIEIQSGANRAAYATITLMPFGISGDALETYQSRVWILNQTPASYVVNPPTGNFAVSAPESLVDFATSDGGLLFTNSDRFLQTKYVNVRQSNGYLYFTGDGSVSVVSNVQTSGSPATTSFNYQNVDPQIGQSWRDTMQDFSRTILFGNETGVYGLYGGSVNKVSAKLDQLFTTAVFPASGGLTPTSAVATLFDIKHYLMLMTFLDPDTGAAVNKMITWNEKDWVITSQTVALTYVGSQKVSSKLYAWGTDGTALYPLFNQPSASLTKRMDTKHYGAPQSFMVKVMDSIYVVGQDKSTGNNGIDITGDYVVSGLAIQNENLPQTPNGIAVSYHQPDFPAIQPYWPLFGAEAGQFPFVHVGLRLTTTSPDFVLGNLMLSYVDVQANR